MKARRIQEQRIKEIAQEVQDRDSNRALVLAEQRDASETESEINDDQKLRRKQLGKFKLPQNDLELVLPDELQDSLRRLKPEGNLLKDRYRSMLVRGKVEARRHLPFRRQAKRKMTEKWTFKDFVL
jgi:nucleolar protein 53